MRSYQTSSGLGRSGQRRSDRGGRGGGNGGGFLAFLGRVVRVVLGIAFVAVLMWLIIPTDRADMTAAVRPEVGTDPAAFIAGQEAGFADIRPGEAKQIIWAGTPGVKTPLAIVYLHGFSAGPEEIRPVPDRVAAQLGANLYFTRLAGHGQTPEAMGRATAENWLADLAQSIAVGEALGDRVILIGTSTGGTLAALAAADPQLSAKLAGVVLISPNFGPRPAAAALLDLPFVRWWGPLLVGANRSFTPANPAQATHWTTTYPTVALVEMARLVHTARATDWTQAKVPLLAIYSPDDQVVRPDRTVDVLAHWGGPVRAVQRRMGAGDDPSGHVLAGDILSPSQTAPTVALIAEWARALPPAP